MWVHLSGRGWRGPCGSHPALNPSSKSPVAATRRPLSSACCAPSTTSATSRTGSWAVSWWTSRCASWAAPTSRPWARCPVCAAPCECLRGVVSVVCLCGAGDGPRRNDLGMQYPKGCLSGLAVLRECLGRPMMAVRMGWAEQECAACVADLIRCVCCCCAGWSCLAPALSGSLVGEGPGVHRCSALTTCLGGFQLC